ncbi:UNVERIFIED_CONTAM: hypothetical protein Scaly_1047200 [Sesamum calycinum]|uniref:Reverse transcriptase zinc-binding domain-containing protein n=1 Tax=Sesamum calycinum TaxID=2727403 RepID=A0AAW2QKC5_9LAMI
MQLTITDYFHKVFQSSAPSNEDIELVIGGMRARVSDKINEALTQPFTKDEVDEINHYLAHKYGGLVGYALLKLDLSKAYDHVELTFLERVLNRLGFVWTANVPPKVRLFTWRTCQNLLPTSANLRRRGALAGGIYPWCGFELEDLLHTLLHCPFTRLVWALSNIPSDSTACSHDDPELWVRGLHSNLDRFLCSRALLICWFLWWARNKLFFENIKISATEIIDRVRGFEESLLNKHQGTEEFEKSCKARHGILMHSS